jgi:hypothetical protein
VNKIETAARSAADKTELKPVKNKRARMLWTEALAAAPWPRPPLAAKHEDAYRQAFAAELVRREIAKPQGEWGGVSGAHRQSEIKLRAPAEVVAGLKARAKTAGKTLNSWALDELLGK